MRHESDQEARISSRNPDLLTRLVAAAAVLLFLPVGRSPVYAQEPLPGANSRLRLTTVDAPRDEILGSFVGWENDTLSLSVLEPDSLRGSVISVRRREITRLEVRTGSRSRTGRGALIGGVIGLGTGALLGGLWGSQAPDVPEPAFLVGAGYLGGIGLAAGALIGAAIGTVSHVDIWEDVDVGGLSLGLQSRRATSLALRVSVPLAVP